jgi:hypothetical protein
MRLYQRVSNGCGVGRVPRLAVWLSTTRTILFDLDGTLVDSAALITEGPRSEYDAWWVVFGSHAQAAMT